MMNSFLKILVTLLLVNSNFSLANQSVQETAQFYSKVNCRDSLNFQEECRNYNVKTNINYDIVDQSLLKQLNKNKENHKADEFNFLLIINKKPANPYNITLGQIQKESSVK
jgi:hypothetical protein